MKRFLVICGVLTGAHLSAQDDVDAMRYSQSSFYGDSRFMAMGGAFGALGANVSCMNFNPAGIAVYRTGEAVITPGIRIQNATASHYGQSSTDFSTKFNIANIGFVSAWDQTNPYPATSKLYPKWNQRNAFGISWNRLADFNSNVTIDGKVDNTSIINDFVNVSQGFYPSQLNGTYEWLAYQTYLVNPNSSSDTNHYWGMMLPSTPLQQNKIVKTTGRMGELAVSFAHAFDDKFYLGATVGIPMVKFVRNTTYTEVDYAHSIKPFEGLKYEEQLVTSGSGYNLKVGGIYRASEKIRIGLYAHTPSVISLTDNYKYKMSASYDTAIYANAPSTFTVDYAGTFKYKLYTPGRLGASVAYVHNRFFAGNLDAEFVGYGGARFKDQYNELSGVNRTIATKYAATWNLRAGAEFNVQPVIFRIGYAGYGSPFGSLSGKFVRSNFCAGVGFKRKSNTYFDLGLIYTTWSEDYYLYDPALVKPTSIQNSVVYITATLGIKFN